MVTLSGLELERLDGDAALTVWQSAEDVNVDSVALNEDFDLDDPFHRAQLAAENATRFLDSRITQVRVPLSRLHLVAEALLYVYRRTHEHDFCGPDDGLGERVKD